MDYVLFARIKRRNREVERMSTGTVDLSTLVAHVPVDRFDIVDGPGAARCMAGQERLYFAQTYVDLVFTLKTAASTDTFRRTLKMTTIFVVQGSTFNFTAIFSGRVVSGVYDMKTRTGYFNLDQRAQRIEPRHRKTGILPILVVGGVFVFNGHRIYL